MGVRDLWALLKETFKDWSEDKASRLAAALSYYTVFSLAPLLVIAIGIASLVFGQEAAQGRLVEQIGGVVGQEAAGEIQAMIRNANAQHSGLLATVIGFATLLFGASGVFGQLQDALNTIWEVQPRPGRGVMGIIKDRFVSFTMVLGTGFLLLVSLLLTTFLASVTGYAEGLLPLTPLFWQLFNFVISFVVITLVFALIFKIVPDVEIAWGDVGIGAAVTALLFIVGKFAIGLYLGNSDVASSYGAAGSLVIILLWVYYSAQILFLGAEFTQVYATRYGSRIKPSENPVRVTEEERAQQGMTRQEDKSGEEAHHNTPSEKAPA